MGFGVALSFTSVKRERGPYSSNLVEGVFCEPRPEEVPGRTPRRDSPFGGCAERRSGSTLLGVREKTATQGEILDRQRFGPQRPRHDSSRPRLLGDIAKLGEVGGALRG